MNQTLRNALFDNDHSTMKQAQKKFLEIVDNNINASYGSQLLITHDCIDGNNQESTIMS